MGWKGFSCPDEQNRALVSKTLDLGMRYEIWKKKRNTMAKDGSVQRRVNVQFQERAHFQLTSIFSTTQTQLLSKFSNSKCMISGHTLFLKTQH